MSLVATRSTALAPKEIDRVSLFQIRLPASLTVEELARELYPMGFYDTDDFGRRYKDMCFLARQLRIRNTQPPHSWQTLEAHYQQGLALEFALSRLYQQLSDYFYTWTAWPSEVLNDAHSLNGQAALGSIWYLFSPAIDDTEVSQEAGSWSVCQRGRLFPKYWESRHFDVSAAHRFALKVPSDDSPVYVAIDSNWLFYQVDDLKGLNSDWNWVDSYVGPASGLLAWARRHGVLAHRVDLVTCDTHHWSVPADAPVGTRR